MSSQPSSFTLFESSQSDSDSKIDGFDDDDDDDDDDVKLPAKRADVVTACDGGEKEPPRKQRRKLARRHDLQLETPDWDLIASSRFGQTTLTQNLSHVELDALIGWATHVSSPQPAEHLNPLQGLPSSPMRPGELRMIHNVMAEFIETKKMEHLELLYREFDQTALVALGMYLEEMMTASLLPLAEAHVRRCRSLGDEEMESDLTLPPEEAILKLRPKDLEGIDTALPTSLPGTHELHSTIQGSPPRRSSSPEEMERVLRDWHLAHTIDAEFFEKNRETYALLVGQRVLSRPTRREQTSGPSTSETPVDTTKSTSSQFYEK